MEGFQFTQLANGVRVLTETIPTFSSASLGIWALTGSSHERPSEAGITHFIEHMLFKGTPKRTAHQIAEEIEGRGGVLNAFTDKERTCYYCRVLADDVAVGFDVLSDMVAHASLDPDELEREKGVVLEEIKRSEDEPGDYVHDLHLQGLWGDHELGLPVIGTRESVSSFGQSDLRQYIDRRYSANNVMVSATGKVDHAELVRLSEAAFGHLNSAEPDPKLSRPAMTPGTNLIHKEVEQVHFCIGTAGSSYYDEDFYPLIVLDAILGGGMSSRLFQEVREKRGLAYAVGSYMLTYTVGGAFTIYGGTGRQTWDQVQEVVRTELDKLMADGPTDQETAKVKRQIAGNMVLGLESASSRMMRMAKNEMVHGRQISVEETVGKINDVTREQVRNLAQRLFAAENMRTTAILPGA
ncbi:MAG: insulinase family protein [Armatimonadetes bacterium]|nr:insulinase family protein [Armatimonadota bacterium]